MDDLAVHPRAGYPLGGPEQELHIVPGRVAGCLHAVEPFEFLEPSEVGELGGDYAGVYGFGGPEADEGCGAHLQTFAGQEGVEGIALAELGHIRPPAQDDILLRYGILGIGRDHVVGLLPGGISVFHGLESAVGDEELYGLLGVTDVLAGRTVPRQDEDVQAHGHQRRDTTPAYINGSVMVASPSTVILLAFYLTLPQETASRILAPEREPSYSSAVVRYTQ